MSNDTRGMVFSSTRAARLAGVTYRQLDYWARTNIMVPSLKAANGSGSARLWSFDDVVALAVLGALNRSGHCGASGRHGTAPPRDVLMEITRVLEDRPFLPGMCLVIREADASMVRHVEAIAAVADSTTIITVIPLDPSIELVRAGVAELMVPDG